MFEFAESLPEPEAAVSGWPLTSSSLGQLTHRLFFLDRLKDAIAAATRNSQKLALILVSLDGLARSLNAGEAATRPHTLAGLEQRLRGTIRAGEGLVWVGPEEVAVLIRDLAAASVATRVADRLLALLRAPLSINGQVLRIEASGGIVITAPGPADPGELLHDAQSALATARSRGAGRYELQDRRLVHSSRTLLDGETQLQRALHDGNLRVYYQPVIELVTGRVREVEALVRWAHPGTGLRPPSEFIPLAERTGLIVPLGQRVMETACRQVRGWHDQYPSAASLSLNVNLSPRQFHQRGLVQDTARALRAAELEAPALKLEITESLVLAGTESVIATLRALKDLGLQLAVDDFGAGHAAANLLRRFPLDTLKIDGVYTDGLGHDPDDTAVVRAVMAFAQTQRLSVTAEGIETEDQLLRLRALGCDRGQGFYIARPLSAAAVTKLLAILANPQGPTPGGA